MDNGRDRSIAERTTRQLGLITHPQLQAIGLTRQQLRTRVDRGTLIPVGRGAYRVAGAPRTHHQRVFEACLATAGVASHRTAAAVHGLDGFRLGGPIEVSVRERRRSKRAGQVIVHCSTSLTADDLTTVGCIPVTTVARTIFGLASLVPVLSERRVANAIDVAVRDGLASDPWLWWRLEQLRIQGRNGVSALERILSGRAAGAVTESWLERETLELIAADGLPLPLCQRRIKARGAFVARVDFLYAAACLVIEVDGHRTHSTVEQRAADAARANQLQLAGFRVLRFTYDDIVQRPQVVLATIRQALGLAMAA